MHPRWLLRALSGFQGSVLQFLTHHFLKEAERSSVRSEGVVQGGFEGARDTLRQPGRVSKHRTHVIGLPVGRD